MLLRLAIQGKVLLLEIPDKKVFVPNLIGLLNAATLDVRPGDVVFDAGTGCGVHAILCALLGAKKVVACDPNAHAVAAARRNAARNGVADRCRFVHAPFEKALRDFRGKFDLVVSTLPNTPTGHRFAREKAMKDAPEVARWLDGGQGGSTLSAELVREASSRLSPQGRIHFHVVDWNDKALVRGALRRAGLKTVVSARAHVPVWGQRCRAGDAFRRRAQGKMWRLNYAALPATVGTGVQVLEASRSPKAERRTLPEIEIEVLR